ncbi:MAG: glycosyltransferase, partial [Anaerolineae bacterium]|nr:glycosyltransferase [Anaerolineae bacterium]
GDVQEIAQSTQMQKRVESGNFAAVLAQMAKDAKRGALTMARAGLDACRDVDLLLAGIGGLFTALAVAEKLSLPLIQAHYIPFTPTRAYPSFLVPKLPPAVKGALGGAYNRISYGLARQMIWQGFRSADRMARSDVLHLPPAPLLGPFDAAATRDSPVLYGYSPCVIPRAPDWDSSIHVTGYWFLDSDTGWTPPDDLAAFLEAGPPPVFVGFGSMSSRKPEEAAALIVSALAHAERRAVLLSGWGGLRAAELPDTIMMVESVPYDWLFPRVAAVVHHGGAGTTSAGLRAGVPSIVVPFFGDQPFWGQRIADLGVGPAPIPRRKLTADRLARAIRQAVTDDDMKQAAADLGRRIRAEDGVAHAVGVIGQFAEH